MATIKEQYITELKRQLLYEMKNEKRNGIYGFIQRTMAYNSNRIEGSTLTEQQTASMFETGTISNEGDVLIRTKDIEEMTGHFRMFNQVIQTLDQPLSIHLIKQMHYNLKTGVFEDMANGYPCGDFKNRRNFVSNITTSLPQDVPRDMTALLNTYLQIQTPTVRDLARLHADYENIHPFQDGNGRTGRMILFRESLKYNMIPIIIHDKNKIAYSHALNKAQTAGDLRKLTECLEHEQKAFFDETKDIILPYDVLQKIEAGKQTGNLTGNMQLSESNNEADGPK